MDVDVRNGIRNIYKVGFYGIGSEDLSTFIDMAIWEILRKETNIRKYDVVKLKGLPVLGKVIDFSLPFLKSGSMINDLERMSIKYRISWDSSWMSLVPSDCNSISLWYRPNQFEESSNKNVKFELPLIDGYGRIRRVNIYQ